MGRVRLSIGGKLGVSAAVGVLLAGVILAVALAVTRHVAEMNADAERAGKAYALGLAANLALDRMRVAIKDIRLAYSDAEIERLGGALGTDVAEVGRLLEEAAAADLAHRQAFVTIARDAAG